MPEQPLDDERDADDLHDASSDDLAAYAWVGELLRPSGDDARMPAATWLRLERALHAESAVREQEAVRAGSGTSRRRGTGWLALAASAALVIGGTAVATQALRDGGTGPSPDVVAAGAPADAMPTERIVASGTNYAPTTLGEQARSTFRQIRTAVTGSEVAGSEAAGSQAPASSASPAALKAGPQPAPGAQGDPGSLMAQMPFLADAASFADCLGRMAAGSEPVDVLFVDIARWDDSMTAAIVLLPASALDEPTGDPAMEHVFVVDAACAVRIHVMVDIDAP